MGILPAFTFFGLDIFGFLRKKPQQTTVLSHISTLQSLHSLTVEAQDPKVGTAEEEAIDITRVVTQKIGEKELLSMGTHLIPQEDLKQIIKNATLPNTAVTKEELVDLENLIDVPKTVADMMMEQ